MRLALRSGLNWLRSLGEVDFDGNDVSPGIFLEVWQRFHRSEEALSYLATDAPKEPPTI